MVAEVTMRNVIGAVLGVFVVVGLHNHFNGRDRSSEPARAADGTPAPQPPPKEVDADTLYDAYAGNELAGDRAWKDRLVAVTGKVAKVEKTLGDAIVTLNGAKYPRAVFVYLNEDQEGYASGLVQDQRVTFVGTVGGAMIIGGVKVTRAALRLP